MSTRRIRVIEVVDGAGMIDYVREFDRTPGYGIVGISKCPLSAKNYVQGYRNPYGTEPDIEEVLKTDLASIRFIDEPRIPNNCAMHVAAFSVVEFDVVTTIAEVSRKSCGK